MKIERWVDSEDLAFVALGVAIGAVAILAFQASSSCELEARARAAIAAPASMSFPFAPNDEAHSRGGGVIVEKARADTCRDLSAPECRATAAPGNLVQRTHSPLDAFSLRLEVPEIITPPDVQIPKDE
ncbi:hypothetical protein [Methylosinus sporium]|uniref:hypothetical protein n=1 Tax=Methylosinus sporium TaxID=428 RepID=UPI000D59E081|nr:hypothetical protein [Methylosinus sporium]PWB88859.1 hypothetical protein C5688_18730 [Methylocystis sp. MitZ-2018]